MLTVILMVTVIVLISSIGYWLMKTYVHDMLIERAEGLAGIGAALIPKNDYLAVLKNTDSTSEEYKRLQSASMIGAYPVIHSPDESV